MHAKQRKFHITSRIILRTSYLVLAFEINSEKWLRPCILSLQLAVTNIDPTQAGKYICRGMFQKVTLGAHKGLIYHYAHYARA